MEALLTVKDLAKKWQVSEKTIREYINNGTLVPCKGIPSIRFSQQYIAELEGIELEKFTQLERKQLQKEINILKQQNEILKNLLREYQAINVKSLNILTT